MMLPPCSLARIEVLDGDFSLLVRVAPVRNHYVARMLLCLSHPTTRPFQDVFEVFTDLWSIHEVKEL